MAQINGTEKRCYCVVDMDGDPMLRTEVGGGARDRNLNVDLPTTTTTITTTMTTPGVTPARTDKEPPAYAKAPPPPLPAWRLTWPLLVKVVLSNRK